MPSLFNVIVSEMAESNFDSLCFTATSAPSTTSPTVSGPPFIEVSLDVVHVGTTSSAVGVFTVCVSSYFGVYFAVLVKCGYVDSLSVESSAIEQGIALAVSIPLRDSSKVSGILQSFRLVDKGPVSINLSGDSTVSITVSPRV